MGDLRTLRQVALRGNEAANLSRQQIRERDRGGIFPEGPDDLDSHRQAGFSPADGRDGRRTPRQRRGRDPIKEIGVPPEDSPFG